MIVTKHALVYLCQHVTLMIDQFYVKIPKSIRWQPSCYRTNIVPNISCFVVVVVCLFLRTNKLSRILRSWNSTQCVHFCFAEIYWFLKSFSRDDKLEILSKKFCLKMCKISETFDSSPLFLQGGIKISTIQTSCATSNVFPQPEGRQKYVVWPILSDTTG